MATINKGFTLSEVAWSNLTQYAILPVYGVSAGIGGEVLYACPVVSNLNITYIANKLDAANQPIQPTLGTAPASDTAWTVIEGGADVLGTVLTGLIPAAGTVIATDTILQLANKTQGNFNGIGTSKLLCTAGGAFDITLGVSPVDFPISNVNMVITNTADIIVDPGNFYTLPAGHIYVAEVTVRGNTFDANTTAILMQFNINAGLLPQGIYSNAAANITFGSQGSASAIIDTTGGAITFKVNATVINGVTAKVSGFGFSSSGGGFSINIYSIR